MNAANTPSIPEKIEGLIYTRHAQRARLDDRFGFIEYVPKNFIKIGCKSVRFTEDNLLKVSYIYSDNRDIKLIINPENKHVVTCWLDAANNTNVFKGRFRLNVDKKTK